MYFFISDEHYGHRNMTDEGKNYTNRPFSTVKEMDETLITNNNNVVHKEDIVVHGGDFTLIKNKKLIYEKYINRLNGKHIFLRGSHDYWLNNSYHEIWERNIHGKYIVVCHYAMRVWARSHYNSMHLYGHSHGNLEPVGKQHDIGVDNNDFYPLSENKIFEIMDKRPDNFNLVRRS